MGIYEYYVMVILIFFGLHQSSEQTGHRDFIGNEIVDFLTKNGSKGTISSEINVYTEKMQPKKCKY